MATDKKKKRSGSSMGGKKRLKLTVLFMLTVFALITVTMVLVQLLEWLIYISPLFGPRNIPPLIEPLLFVILTLLVGIGLSFVFAGIIVIPLGRLGLAVRSITEGDYSVRVRPSGIKVIQKLGRRFNQMAEELESVETLRGDFVNNFSHEFKTPITSLRGFAQLLRTETLPEEERNSYLDIIISESERLAEMSHKVLLFSNIENLTFLPDPAYFNVSEQIRLVIVLLENKWAENGNDIIFDNKEYFIHGNQEMLEQIWINLIDNAVKFSPYGSEISIEITEADTNLHITVSDSGCGIPEDVLPHIFDKFYQGDPSHRTRGNGLGLSLVKKIAELHGGTVTVDSEPGEGTSFTVSLPIIV